VLGQLLSAKASLNLLESRAARSIPDDSTSPWPEFAEYSCFSCHHELGKEIWPGANIAPTARAGSLQWGTWYSPMTKVLLPVAPSLNLETPDSSYGLLKAEMTRPLPDAALVVRRAHAASEELGRLAEALNRGQIRPSEIRPMLEAARNTEIEEQPLDWDRAARQYLAIVAFDNALGELEPGRANRLPRFRLEALFKDLDFPGKVGNRTGLFDSPGRWNLLQIKEDFDSLLDPRANP